MTKIELRDKFEKICDAGGLPYDLIPVIKGECFIGYRIIIDKIGYTLDSFEYGELRKSTWFPDFESLSFEVFEYITCMESINWELNNRNENEDSRIQLFSKHIELMTKLFGKEKIKPMIDRYNILMRGIYIFE